MTDTNQLPPHTITINDHPEPQIMQWSDLELAAVKKYAESYALKARAQAQGEAATVAVDHFDNAPNTEFTNRIYPPVEIGTKLYAAPQATKTTQAEVTLLTNMLESAQKEAQRLQKEVDRLQPRAEVTDEQIIAAYLAWCKTNGTPESFARAVLALRPAAVPMTQREIELIDGMIEVQLDHAQRCDAIGNRVMGEKQKGWDMERVELLRRIKSIGITAQAKKEDA